MTSASARGLGSVEFVFEDDDVVQLLRDAIEREGGQVAFAKHHGVNRTYLNMVLNGKRPMGDAVAEALGLHKVYVAKAQDTGPELQHHKPQCAELEDEGLLMDRLQSCIEALRVLSQTHDPKRAVLVERNIDEYLKTETGSLRLSLQRLRDAINWQKAAKRQGEDWSIAKDYVRSLLHSQR
jgi:hypothetical protein